MNDAVNATDATQTAEAATGPVVLAAFDLHKRFGSDREVLAGLSVTGFGAALVGSLLYSVCGLVIDAAMERLFSREGD